MSSFEIVDLGKLVVPDRTELQAMVYACGCEYVSQHLVSPRFGITCHGTRHLYLAHFKHDTEAEKTKQLITEMGDKELALVEHLLVVGAHPDYRELARESPLVCLGSSAEIEEGAEKHRQNPYFSRYRNGIGLYMRHYAGKWHSYCRFLLMEKCP